MRTRYAIVRWIGTGVCGVLLASTAAAGQAEETSTRDLQGVWDFRSAIPFERPDDFEGRATLTAEEAAAFAQERVDAQNVDLWRDENGRLPVSGGYNNFWYDRGTSLGEERRTSLVVDPPDGRLPARSDEARARGERRQTAARARRVRARGPRGVRAVHHGVQLGPADEPQRLQQQHAAVPDR